MFFCEVRYYPVDWKSRVENNRKFVLTESSQINRIGVSMERYPNCLKHLVLLVALLHTLAGGHTVCYAYSYLPQFDQYVKRHCGHLHCQPPENHPLTCHCQDCPRNCEHFCNSNEQQAIRASRSIDEAKQLVPVPFSDCVSFVFAFYPSVLPDVRDAISVFPPALPLRLHLFYGVLLI